MKRLLLASALTVALLSAGTVVVIYNPGDSGNVASISDARSSEAPQLDTSGATGEAAEVEGDEVLEKEVAGLDEAPPRERSRSYRWAKSVGKTTARQSALAPTAGPADEEKEHTVPTLEGWLSSQADTVEGLRVLVHKLVDEKLELLRKEARDAAVLRRKEHQEMHNGPFGKYNYKVNLVGKKLSLDDDQKRYYHETLVDFARRFQEARRDVKWLDSQSRKEFHARQRELQEQLDDTLLPILAPEQAEVYERIPEWQRRPDALAIESLYSPPAPEPGDLARYGGREHVRRGADSGSR